MAEEEEIESTTREQDLYNQFLGACEDALEGEASVSALGVVRQFLKDTGTIAQMAVLIAKDPKGPVAMGIGRIVPFAATEEDDDEMVG